MISPKPRVPEVNELQRVESERLDPVRLEEGAKVRERMPREIVVQLVETDFDEIVNRSARRCSGPTPAWSSSL
jgi:hypothetical protein